VNFYQAMNSLKYLDANYPAARGDWLDRNGWKYVLNAANRPIVGRYFARLHLAGVSVARMAPQEAWKPDFSMLK
jgi:hypothetical protein